MDLKSVVWENPNDPFWLWFNIGAGGVGLLLGMASTWAALIAARRAQDAKTAAVAARNVATAFARHDRLLELEHEIQDAQLLFDHAELLSRKCTSLRGTVTAFKTDAGSLVSKESQESLDMIREQLTEVIEAVFNTRLTPENRSLRLANTFGLIGQHMSFVRATLGKQIKESNNGS